MSDTIRSFIAIGLPEPVIAHIREVQSGLKARNLKMSWVRPENMHLTLKFLGNIKPSDVESIGREMAGAAKAYRPFSLSAKGLGVFPSIKRPRVVWAGLRGDMAALIDMQKDLESRLEKIGFPKENKPFRGHLTLARGKGKIDSKSLLDSMNEIGHFESPVFVADELVLYKSDLKPSGAVYTDLLKVELDVGKIAGDDPT